ncbi:MAG: conjugal transfer protein TraF, partial [Deferribacterales bacterium]|nr:conjugal transfer protein TraF [Deferribacterales bacterium]
VKAVDTSQFPEAVSRFNIKSVPSIILVERVSERWMPIASGLMTYEEIEERLYRTLKYLKGETDEKDFSNPVRPDNYVFNTDTSITGSMDR